MINHLIKKLSITLLVLLAGFSALELVAQGTTVVSATVNDLCVNGEYKSVPTITMYEVDRTSWATDAANVTFEIDLPANLRFLPGVGSVTLTNITGNGNNLIDLNINVTATKATVSYLLDDTNGGNANRRDGFIISGLAVRAIAGGTQTYSISRSGGTANQTGNGVGVQNLVTINAVFVPTPTLNTYQSQYCQSETLQNDITATGSNLKWYSNSSLTTEIVAAAGLSNPTHAQLGFNNTTVGTQRVWVTASDGSGCQSLSAEVSIQVNQKPTLNSITDQTVCPGDLVNIGFSSTPLSSITWTNAVPTSELASNGNGNIVFLAQANTSGIDRVYPIQAIATTSNGCKDTITFNLTVASLPAVPLLTVGTTSYCKGDSFVNDISATGTNLKWYSDAALNNEILSIANPNAPTLVELGFDNSLPGVKRAYVTASNASNCESAAAEVLINVYDYPNLLPISNQELCANEAAYIDFTTSGGASLTWVVTNHTTGFGIGASGSGDIIFLTRNVSSTPKVFDIEVTSIANGCESNQSFQLTILPQPVITIPTSQVDVCNDNDAFDLSSLSLTANVPGTFTFYGTGVLADGVTLDATVFSSGIKSIGVQFVSDDASCVVSQSINLVNIIGSAAITTGPDQTICEGGTATMAAVLGGSASSLTWTSLGDGTFDSPTNPNAIYTPGNDDIIAGTVQLEVVTNDPDGAGPCTAAGGFIILTINPKAEVTAGTDFTVCAGQTIELNGSKNTQAGTIQWMSSGTGSFDFDNNLNAIYTPSEADTTAREVTLTITSEDPDGAGPCLQVTDQVVVTILPQPVVNAGIDQTICADGTVSLSGTKAGSILAIEWLSSSGNNAGFANRTNLITTYTPNATDTINGSVVLTLASTDAASPCVDVSDEVVITINPLPIINAGADVEICNGSSVQLNASGVGTFEWSPAAGLDNVAINNPIANPTTSTTYMVTITDGNGCQNTDQVTVTVNPLPITGVITGPMELCVDATITLISAESGGTGDLVVVWNSSDPAVATINSSGEVIGISAGTTNISYTVTDDKTCAVTSANYEVTVNPLPVAGLITGPNEVCVGSTITLNSDVSGGNGPYTIVWNSSDTDIATINNAGELSALAQGSVDISYTITDAKTCEITSAVYTVLVNPLPIAGNITGATEVCVGENTTLNASPSGGTSPYTITWQSSDTDIATITNAGELTGVAQGIVNIIYTIEDDKSCQVVSNTFSITVNPLPIAGDISGPNEVCAGSAINLSSNVSGGTSPYTISWQSSDTNIATITNAGVLTGLAQGSVDVNYTVVDDNTCQVISDNFTVTVNPLSIAGAITGPVEVCVDGIINLISNPSGGTGTLLITWNSSNPTVATIDNTGELTALTAGSTNITYSISDDNTCEVTSAIYSITVNPLPIAGVIAGPSEVCLGETITLISNESGGTAPLTVSWNSSNPAVATINSSGELEGQLAGSTIITYTVTDDKTCELTSADFTVTVNPLPVAGVIIGDTEVCVGNTLNLTENVSGGNAPYAITWNSSNLSVASINSSGVVSGLIAGTTDITYTVTDNNSCEVTSGILTVTVNPLPIAAAITGLDEVCVGESITLTSNASGGTGTLTITWQSTNVDVATIDASGVVSALSSGTTDITYTVTDDKSCEVISAAFTVTVNPLPAAGLITGPSDVCVGENTTLIAAPSGGTGNYNITWNSSDEDIATITNAGVLTGILAGDVDITYTVTDDKLCEITSAVYTVTVSPLPIAGNITGTNEVCEGSAISLTANPSGGTGPYSITWNSSDTNIATIDSNGQVSGIAQGSTNITYTLSDANSCEIASAIFSVAVNPLPLAGAITGASEVCVNESITLVSNALGGTGALDITWNSTNTSVATVDASGVLSAVAAGSTDITYTVTDNKTCEVTSANFTVIVNPLPIAGTISGLSEVCIGQSITLNSNPSGGEVPYTITWNSTNPAVASVDGNGEVSGHSQGSTDITYSISDANICEVTSVVFEVVVNPLPIAGPISGDNQVCVGNSIILNSDASGGTGSLNITWESSNTSVATINVTSGELTALSSGTTEIRYTVFDDKFCGVTSSFFIVTVQPLPLAGAITGASEVCIDETITLGSNPSGGAAPYAINWFSSNPAVASINSSGEVSGISAGTTDIAYTITDSETCEITSAAFTVTVNPLPIAGNITGASELCEDRVINLTANPSGGQAPYTIQWNSSDETVAIVDSNGAVTSIAEGTTDITYTVTDANLCSSTSAVRTITVNPLPIAGNISGPNEVCVGSTISLTSDESGGTGLNTIEWNSSNPSVATIDANGEVTGQSSGSSNITYTVIDSKTCDAVSAIFTVYVNPLPIAGVITGANQVCEGESLTLNTNISAGTAPFDISWNSTNTSIATINNSGELVGVLAGTTDITYTVIDAKTCQATSVAYTVTVNPLPTVEITGTTTICSGESTNISFILPAGQFDIVYNDGSSDQLLSDVSNGDFITVNPTTSKTYAVVSIMNTATNCEVVAPNANILGTATITVNTPAEVSAGSDATICETESYTLSGTANASAGVITWSTAGDGNFDDENSLTAIYTPGEDDITNGSVILTITSSDPAGPCIFDTDQLTLTINTNPIVDAGADFTSCQSDQVELIGFVSGGASTGTWSIVSGSGILSASTNNSGTVTATYEPGPGDDGQTVQFRLLSNDPVGPCNAVSETVNVFINQDATVSIALASDIICEDDTIDLEAILGGSASSVTWSSSSSSVNFSSTSSLTTTYTPSASDISNGTVTLTATTDDPDGAGPCIGNSELIVITINRKPIATLEPDKTVCETDNITITGTIEGNLTTVGNWEIVSGDGSLTDQVVSYGAVSARYNPAPSDANQVVSIRLFTNDIDGAEPCAIASAIINITINEAPTVSAGADFVICEDDDANLSGLSGGSTTDITWSSTTGGSFSPDANDLNAIYTPNATDITNGFVDLTITSNNPAGPCEAVSDVVRVTINRKPIATLEPDKTVCETDNITITGTIEGNLTTVGNWEIVSGDGSLTDQVVSYGAVSARYNPAPSDANQVVSIRLFTNDIDGAEPCAIASAIINITINEAPTVSAGADFVICEDDDANLSGLSGGSTTDITWSSTTGGSFSPDANDLNAIYTPNATDITNGFVDLTITSNNPSGPCEAVSDVVRVTINRKPLTEIINAPTIICEGETIALLGTIDGSATTSTWTASPGGGVFTPNSGSLSVSYAPSAADISAGTVVFTLTTNDTDGAGPCIAAEDQVSVQINPKATVNAGLDLNVCATDLVNLTGTIGGSATMGTWEVVSGSGSLSASNTSGTSVTATYTPTSTDVGASVQLRLITNDPDGAEPCTAVSDVITITVNEAPTVNAGSDFEVCRTIPVELVGTFGGSASSATWSIASGSGTVSSSTIVGNEVRATYNPGTAGTIVVLRLTTNNPTGPCEAIFDEVNLTINQEAIVNAGSASTICEGEIINLSGVLDGTATSATWSAVPGGGDFGNAGDLITTYAPSAADISNGSVTFTLLSNNPAGPCPAVSSNRVVTINLAPRVDAGADQTICEDDVVSLSGSRSGSTTTTVWSSPTAGVFSNVNSLNATYTPSAADITNGSVLLTLSSTDTDGAGPCIVASDQVLITINPAPRVDAGANQTTCVNSAITVTGTLSGSATSGTWSILSGQGALSANTVSGNNVSVLYTPVGADAGQTVTLRLTTNDPDGAGPCLVRTDDMNISIEREPIVSAGANAEICAYDTFSFVGRSTATDVGSVLWTTSGDGSFSANNVVNPIYTPGDDDKANGSVTLTLRGNGINVCAFVENSMTLTIKPIPVINALADQSLCPGETMTPFGFGADLAGGTFSWSISNSAILTLSPNLTSGTGNLPSIVARANNDGIEKTSVVTVNYTLNGCLAATRTFNIVVKPTPVTTSVSNITVCPGAPIIIDFASNVSGATFNWTNSNTAIGLANSGTGNINYTAPENLSGVSIVSTLNFTALSNACVSTNRTFTITVLPRPVVVQLADIEVCPGDPINTFFQSNVSGSGFSWTNDNTNTGISASSNGNLSFTAAGNDTNTDRISTITVTATSPGNCLSDVMTFRVIVKPKPVLDAIADIEFCPGDAIPTINFSDNSLGASQFNWVVQSGSASLIGLENTSGVGSIPSFVAAVNNSGLNRDVVIRVTSTLNACESLSRTFRIRVKPTPILNAIANIEVSSGEPIITNFISNTSSTTYTWTSTNATVTINPSGTGNINIAQAPDNFTGSNLVSTITVVPTATGCEGPSRQFTITIKPTPVLVQLPDVIVCPFEPIEAIFVSNTPDGTTFNWTNNNTNVGLAANGSGDINYTAPANTTGVDFVATISYSATRSGSTSETKTFTITVKHQPVLVAVSDISLCAGDTFNEIVFADNTGVGSFNWTATNHELLGMATASGSGNLPSFTMAQNNTGSAIQSVITFTSSVNGCESEPSSFVITLKPTPIITNIDMEVCAATNAEIVFTSNTEGGESYAWSLDNNNLGIGILSGTTSSINFNAVNNTLNDLVTNVTVRATINGCEGPSKTFRLVIKPIPDIINSITDLTQTICSEQNSLFVPITNIPGSRFEWLVKSKTSNIVNQVTSGEGNITDVLVNTGNTDGTILYGIRAIDVSGAQCVGREVEFLVTVRPKPSIATTQELYTVCNSSPVSIPITNPNGVSGTTFDWTASANNSGIDLSGSGNAISFTPNNPSNLPDTIEFNITARANACAGESKLIKVAVSPRVIITTTPDFAVCQNDEIRVFGTVSGAATSGLWNVASGSGQLIRISAEEALYIPSAADVNTTVVLRYNVDNLQANSPCSSAFRNVNITINRRSLADMQFIGLGSSYCINSEPVNLVATPSGGQFSGMGVVNLGGGNYSFDPAIAGIDNHRIVYTFTNVSNCTDSIARTISVTNGPNPDFQMGAISKVLLSVGGADEPLTPLGTIGGTFTTSAAAGSISQTGANFSFRPSIAGPGFHTITYRVSDNACEATRVITIEVLPAPGVTYSYTNLCNDEYEAQFVPIITNQDPRDQVIGYRWFFNKGGSSNNQREEESPIENFGRAGEYVANLEVTTALGGRYNSGSLPVLLGNIRTQNFTFNNTCQGVETEFSDVSVSDLVVAAGINRGQVNYWKWNFGDPGSGVNNQVEGTDKRNVGHLFSTFGQYQVTLTIQTEFGCESTLVKTINILPSEKPTASNPYIANFDEQINGQFNRGWYTDGFASSWQLGTPNGARINSASSGANAWVTGINGSFNSSESSSLVGPCFDISELEKPMISLRIWSDAEVRSQGLILQYTTNSGATWNILGDINKGLNWYNVDNINSSPGGTGFGNRGWSLPNTGWFTASYALDELNLSESEKRSITFRLAFASTPLLGTATVEGFAIDDIYVGERSRKVLLEHFTNLNTTDARSRSLNFGNVLNSTVQNDVLAIQYHTSFPAVDAISRNASVDSDTRALNYAITEVPKFVVDGAKIDFVSETDLINKITTEALFAPEISIDLQYLSDNQDDQVKVQATLRPLVDINEEVRVFFAFVEREVDNDGVNYNYLLRRMQPGPNGLIISGLQAQVPVVQQSTWLVESVFDPTKLGVVCFVMRKSDMKVLQTQYAAVTDPKRSSSVTGVGTQLSDRFVSVYPNPASDVITIEFSQMLEETLQYQLIDARGVRVKTGYISKGQRNHTLDLSGIRKGVYIIQLKSDTNASIQKKIVVSK